MGKTEANRIANQARDMHLDIPYPLTFSEFLNKRYHSAGMNGMLLDNADKLLEQLASKLPLHAITLTGEE